MTDSEREILLALAWMVEHTISSNDGLFDYGTGANEMALRALARHGLVELRPGGGKWTMAGYDLLNLSYKDWEA